MPETTKRIIYAQDDGTVAILSPAPTCTKTVEQIAEQDVPTGKSYQIIEESDIPTDRTYRNAWPYEES